MLWNRICVVVVSIGLLKKAYRLLAGFGPITLLADRAFL
jgi:hypothetical protein